MTDLKVEETTSRRFKATRRLYLDKEKARIVDEDDPEASFLLAAEGQEVSAEDAEKYGLTEGEGAREAGDEAPETAASQPPAVEGREASAAESKSADEEGSGAASESGTDDAGGPVAPAAPSPRTAAKRGATKTAAKKGGAAKK